LADYPIESQLVINSSGQLIPGGKVYVYDSDDTANTTLLELTDPNGLPIANPLTASAISTTPEIRTPVLLVKMIGENGAALTVLSAKGVVQKAEEAEAFVKGITVSAVPGTEASASVDETGKIALVLPKGDKGDPGPRGPGGVPLVEDPNDPGTFNYGDGLVEDSTDPGTFLIGV
jgi:hypothetical protein